jgi:hypothetical protein
MLLPYAAPFVRLLNSIPKVPNDDRRDIDNPADVGVPNAMPGKMLNKLRRPS